MSSTSLIVLFYFRTCLHSNILAKSMDWDALWADEAQVEAATGEEGRVSLFSADMVEPTAELTFAVNGDTYIFSVQVFFQANKFLIERLIETALGGSSGDTALDLYSGVGLFALPLAKRFKKVVAVEEHPVSSGFALKNVENARSSNIEVISSSVAGFLRSGAARDADLVLLDPPRSGTEKQAIPLLIKLGPREISYVSCEPSILARDLRMLLDSGYRIAKITAIDLLQQLTTLKRLFGSLDSRLCDFSMI